LREKQHKSYSFESLFHRYIAFTVTLLLILLSIIFYFSAASTLVIVTALLLVIVPFVAVSYYVKNTIQTPLNGLSASLESIRNEDYSLRVKPKFNHGAIKALSDEVSLMASDLRVRKLHYDQHAVLVLNLIKQLATPIAVFDKSGRLKHANDAFSAWCRTPWQQVKYAHANSLGLSFHPHAKVESNDTQDKSAHRMQWQIANEQLADRWQLRYSQLSMQDEHFQLVVLTNIEQLVHETEQIAWHKMTRVLSHEINNSLSPIKSLAQSLEEIFAQQSLDENAQQALGVIVSRSDSLMQFVNRYASLAQQFEINIETVNLVSLINKITALFTHEINVTVGVERVLADKVLLEQTLINLVKNAVEASDAADAIEIISQKKGKHLTLSIIDKGAGIANPDNLFVPFYTTKEGGKGIGLALCRNMIEQQGGRLSLQNRQDKKGAIASIELPQ